MNTLLGWLACGTVVLALYSIEVESNLSSSTISTTIEEKALQEAMLHINTIQCNLQHIEDDINTMKP